MNNEKNQPEAIHTAEPVPANPSVTEDAGQGPMHDEIEELQTEEPQPIGEPAEVTPPDPQEIQEWNRRVRQRMAQKSRRSFLLWGAGIAAGVAGFEWLTSRSTVGDVPWPLRKTLEFNERIASGLFSEHRLSRTFNPNQAGPDRVNGDVGLDEDVDVAAWRLSVEGLAGGNGTKTLDLDAIRRLPRVEMTTEFKCIEGWSVIVQWAGVRFTDFMKAFPPRTGSGRAFNLKDPADLPPYVSMMTPDDGYYVGLDMESMLHPQTLLCYERNGRPLTQEHGAPLRLVVPVKYGVKNIKRIGTIRYSTARPADYWAERGYDWYVGL